MIHLQLVQAHIDADGRTEVVPVGEIKADGQRLEITPGDVLSADLTVISLLTGQPVSRDEAPEEWARSLPGSLRGVGMAINVLDDSDPLPEAIDDEEPFELSDTAVRRAVNR